MGILKKKNRYECIRSIPSSVERMGTHPFGEDDLKLLERYYGVYGDDLYDLMKWDIITGNTQRWWSIIYKLRMVS